MGKFSRIFKHIESKDLRNKYEQKKVAKIEEENKKEDTKKYISSAMEQVKYNWRSKIDVGETIREAMTTSDVATISTPANPDEVLNDTPLDNADDFAPGARGDVADFYDGTVGASIKSGGSGSGNNGGFDIGDHLAFDGDGSTDGARWMITQPIDTTRLNQIVMRIVTGNGSNGGETPDDSGEGLVLYYKTPQMNDFIPIDYFPTLSSSDFRGGDIGYPDFDTNDMSGYVNNVIIPVGGGAPTLQDYSKYIPTYARGEGTQFLIYQFESSGSGKDNYGIKNISYRRTTPIQVVAPLDDPEASSFIRSAPPGSTPKKRKKDVDDKLTASDEYTTFKFGNEFPGQEVRVGGEDPFKSAKIGDDVEPSPQGKDEVKKSFGDFNATSKDTTEKQKASEVEKLTGELNDVYDNPDATLEDFTSDENVARVERILELDPNNIDALHMRSFISSINGDQDAAIVDAERAYEVDPDNEFTKPMLEYAYDDKISTTWGAAETMADLMNDTELMDTLDKAIKLNPDNSLNYWYRSQINEADQNYDAVVEDLEKMLEINPEDADSELRLSQVKQAQAEKIRQEQEEEAERLEKEAREIEEKAYKDYYEDPDWNIESEIEPVEVSSWDKNDTSNNISDLYKADYETAKATIENLPKQSESIGATYNGDNIDYIHLSQINKNIENRDVRFRSPESMSQEELQRSLISLSLEIEDQKYWVNDLSKKLKLTVTGAPGYALGGTKFTGEINGTTVKDIEDAEDKLYAMADEHGNFQGDWRAQNEKVNKLAYQRKADSEIKKLNAEQYQLITQYNKLYDAFMGVEGDSTSLNLPDTIQKVLDQTEKFDLSDKERESIQALLDLPELKSSEDFAKVIGSNLVDPDALKLGYFKLGGGMLNYAVPIALSEILNQPILVDDSKIPDKHRNGMRDALQENILSDGKLPPWFAVNTTPQPYVDQNIRTNPETGKVESNYKNPNLPPGDQPGQIQHIDNLKSKPNVFQPSYDTSKFNPIMGQGGAQYQFVVPEDGSAPYMLYVDHAYNNKNSPDVSEIPGSDPNEKVYSSYFGDNPFTRWADKNIKFNKMLADGVTAISDFIHRGEEVDDGTNRGTYRRGDSTAENTRGMAGYPPNIRGDLITRVKIPLSDFSKEVQNIVLGGTFDDEGNYIPPGFEDPIRTDEIGKPEIDPFKDEIKPDLGAKDGDELAFVDGGGSILAAILALGLVIKGGETIYTIYKKHKEKIDKKIKEMEALGSISQFTGGDATAAATAAATTKKNKKRGRTSMVAHFVPKGQSLFEKIKSKSFFNPKDIKPEFPENPPPKLDPKTGMHPEYGKKANRYKKLDPHSANAMPPTGDPEIDAVVNKQKTINKIKKMAKKA